MDKKIHIDKEAAFEKSASWEDVRAKGDAILANGGVEIYEDSATQVCAYVMSGVVEGMFPISDGGPYEVILSKRSWENKKNVGGWVQAFLCDCAWGQYHSGRPGQGFSGRFCSHAWATLKAANARASSSFTGDRTASLSYNETNFYEGTKANWVPVNVPKAEPDFMSDSGSMYWYYPEGVVRGSDHWGNNIGDCNWHMVGDDHLSAWFDEHDEVRYGFCPWQGFESNLEDDMVRSAGKFERDEFGDWAKDYGDNTSGLLYEYDGKWWVDFFDGFHNLRTFDVDDFVTAQALCDDLHTLLVEDPNYTSDYLRLYTTLLASREESKMAYVMPTTYPADSDERFILETLADELTKAAPNCLFYVRDGYFDAGQDWKWTSIICEKNGESWWALSPAEQSHVIETGDVATVCYEVLHGDYGNLYAKKAYWGDADEYLKQVYDDSEAAWRSEGEPLYAPWHKGECPRCGCTMNISDKYGICYTCAKAEWGDYCRYCYEPLNGFSVDGYCCQEHKDKQLGHRIGKNANVDFAAINKMVEFGLDLYRNQFKNWQSLFDVQNDEDVQYYKDGLDMIDEDWQEGCRRIWEEISMTADKTAGTWTIDDAFDYRVHNYLGENGCWANVIQDGINDYWYVIFYNRKGQTLDSMETSSEEEAKAWAQAAVDSCGESVYATKSTAKLPGGKVAAHDLHFTTSGGSQVAEWDGEIVPETWGEFTDVNLFGQSYEFSDNEALEYGIVDDEGDLDPFVLLDWIRFEYLPGIDEEWASREASSDGIWECDDDFMFKSIPDWDLTCGIYHANLGIDVGDIWEWNVIQGYASYVIDEGSAQSEEDAMSCCDMAVQKYIDSVPLGLDDDDIDLMYVNLVGKKADREWAETDGIWTIDFGDGCAAEAYEPDETGSDWFLYENGEIVESGIERSLEEAMAAAQAEHTLRPEAAREVEAAEHHIYDEWEDFGNGCYGKTVWDIWTPQGSSSVVQTPLFTCNVQPLDGRTWEVLVDGSAQFSGWSAYEYNFTSPQSAMEWADGEVMEELLMDGELNDYIASSKLGKRRWRKARRRSAELYQLEDLFDDSRNLEGETRVDDNGLWHWSIRDLDEDMVAVTDEMAGVGPYENEDDAFSDMIDVSDVRLAYRDNGDGWLKYDADEASEHWLYDPYGNGVWVYGPVDGPHAQIYDSKIGFMWAVYDDDGLSVVEEGGNFDIDKAKAIAVSRLEYWYPEKSASRKVAFADTYIDLIYVGGEMYSAETHVEDSDYGVWVVDVYLAPESDVVEAYFSGVGSGDSLFQAVNDALVQAGAFQLMSSDEREDYIGQLKFCVEDDMKYANKVAGFAISDMNRDADDAYNMIIEDESGDNLELQITKWSNGWDWLLLDQDGNFIADGDQMAWESPQKALDDFNDWCDFNINGGKNASHKTASGNFGIYDLTAENGDIVIEAPSGAWFYIPDANGIEEIDVDEARRYYDIDALRSHYRIAKKKAIAFHDCNGDEVLVGDMLASDEYERFSPIEVISIDGEMGRVRFPDGHEGDMNQAGINWNNWRRIAKKSSANIGSSTYRASRKAAHMYTDTFEYGFCSSEGFKAGMCHIDDEEGFWICELYGINDETWDAYGAGDTWVQACENALDDLPFAIDGDEVESFISYVLFTITERNHWLVVEGSRRRSVGYQQKVAQDVKIPPFNQWGEWYDELVDDVNSGNWDDDMTFEASYSLDYMGNEIYCIVQDDYGKSGVYEFRIVGENSSESVEWTDTHPSFMGSMSEIPSLEQFIDKNFSGHQGDLQKVIDSIFDPRIWREKVVRFGNDHGLVVNNVNDCLIELYLDNNMDRNEPHINCNLHASGKEEYDVLWYDGAQGVNLYDPSHGQDAETTDANMRFDDFDKLDDAYSFLKQKTGSRKVAQEYDLEIYDTLNGWDGWAEVFENADGVWGWEVNKYNDGSSFAGEFVDSFFGFDTPDEAIDDLLGQDRYIEAKRSADRKAFYDDDEFGYQWHQNGDGMYERIYPFGQAFVRDLRDADWASGDWGLQMFDCVGEKTFELSKILSLDAAKQMADDFALAEGYFGDGSFGVDASDGHRFATWKQPFATSGDFGRWENDYLWEDYPFVGYIDYVMNGDRIDHYEWELLDELGNTIESGQAGRLEDAQFACDDAALVATKQRGSSRKTALRNCITWTQEVFEGDSQWWYGESENGKECAIELDYNGNELKFDLYYDGILYDDVFAKEDGEGQVLNLDEAKERLNVYAFEDIEGVRFERDYWGQPIIGSKSAAMGKPDWVRGWDTWNIRPDRDELICCYGDVYNPNIERKDAWGSIKPENGQWVASVSYNNGWDFKDVGVFDDLDKAIRACDDFVCCGSRVNDDVSTLMETGEFYRSASKSTEALSLGGDGPASKTADNINDLVDEIAGRLLSGEMSMQEFDQFLDERFGDDEPNKERFFNCVMDVWHIERDGKTAAKKTATRQFTYAEMKELEDEIEGTELHNADRFKDGGAAYYGSI